MTNLLNNTLLVLTHEVCVCGHCRCDHTLGFEHCLRCRTQPCARYTWPGPGAQLPASHTPRQRFKPPKGGGP